MDSVLETRSKSFSISTLAPPRDSHRTASLGKGGSPEDLPQDSQKAIAAQNGPVGKKPLQLTLKHGRFEMVEIDGRRLRSGDRPKPLDVAPIVTGSPQSNRDEQAARAGVIAVECSKVINGDVAEQIVNIGRFHMVPVDQ